MRLRRLRAANCAVSMTVSARMCRWVHHWSGVLERGKGNRAALEVGKAQRPTFSNVSIPADSPQRIPPPPRVSVRTLSRPKVFIVINTLLRYPLPYKIEGRGERRARAPDFSFGTKTSPQSGRKSKVCLSTFRAHALDHVAPQQPPFFTWKVSSGMVKTAIIPHHEIALCPDMLIDEF